MAIDKDTYLVNTERLGIRKLSKKFWKEVSEVTALTDLRLYACHNLPTFLHKIRELDQLELLAFSSVEFGERVEDLIIPDGVRELKIASVTCDNWHQFPTSPAVTSLKIKRMSIDDTVAVIPKFAGLETLHVRAYGDDELDQLTAVLAGLVRLQNITLQLDEATEVAIERLMDTLSPHDAILTLQYQGSVADDTIKWSASGHGVKLQFEA